MPLTRSQAACWLHLFSALVLACALPASLAQPTFVSASSPLVLWGGRPSVNASDGSVAFDWEGTSASFVVTGVGATVTMWCNITLDAAHSGRVSVYVNDQDAANLMLHQATPSYLLAAALPFASNNITVLYAFEPGSSGADRTTLRTPSVFGFSAGSGGAFGAPTPAARRIDILGDSISAGSMYDRLESVGGALSLGTGCHPWSPPTSYSSASNWETYLCRYFRANCSTTAWSGGVLVDPSVSHCPPRAHIPQLYTQTFGTGPEAWDFARATRPDLVIIYLGTNDFACANVTDALFTAAAGQLMRNVTRYYSASPGPAAATRFMLAVGPMSPTRPLAAIAAAIAAASAEGIAASLLDMRNVTLDGCGSHPCVCVWGGGGQRRGFGRSLRRARTSFLRRPSYPLHPLFPCCATPRLPSPCRGPVGHWSMALEAAPQIKALMGWD